MKIDFSTVLLDLKNKPLLIRSSDDKTKLIDATLGDVCAEAMLSMLVHDKDETGKSKYKRHKLAGKVIKSNGFVKLESDEIVTIKERVGMVYGPAIVGPAYDILEGKENAEVEVQADGGSAAQKG